MQRTFCRRLTCIARHLATTFEIIATVGTIGTLHRTEFMPNFVTCTLLHKERTRILQYENTGNKTRERFTFVGYIAKIFNNIQDTHSCCPLCIEIVYIASDAVPHTYTIIISLIMGICLCSIMSF